VLFITILPAALLCQVSNDLNFSIMQCLGLVSKNVLSSKLAICSVETLHYVWLPAYSAPPDPLSGLRGGVPRKGRLKEKVAL